MSSHLESVLVRVSPEILERMKTGDVEPVVILGVEEQEDGTHDMTLQTPAITPDRVNKRLPQRQDSLNDQLADVAAMANKMGCYDAADWILRGSL